jgi:hypothetical protein
VAVQLQLEIAFGADQVKYYPMGNDKKNKAAAKAAKSKNRRPRRPPMHVHLQKMKI